MRYIVVMLIVLALSPTAHALQVLEGEGRSYPIAETSQSKSIARKYEKASKNKLSRRQLEKVWVAKLKKQLPLAREDKTRLVDIAYTLPFDLKGKDGKILFAKGYQHNPLSKITMTSLIVIDGEKKEHIHWAREVRKTLTNSKILIARGSFLSVQRNHKLRVFHLKDQMVDRFQIKRVPCTIVQKGEKLELSEYRLSAY